MQPYVSHHDTEYLTINIILCIHKYALFYIMHTIHYHVLYAVFFYKVTKSVGDVKVCMDIPFDLKRMLYKQSTVP